MISRRRMVLVVGGLVLDEAPNNTRSLFHGAPHLKEAAAHIASLPPKVVSSIGLLYLHQREFAVTLPHDSNFLRLFLHLIHSQFLSEKHVHREFKFFPKSKSQKILTSRNNPINCLTASNIRANLINSTSFTISYNQMTLKKSETKQITKKQWTRMRSENYPVNESFKAPIIFAVIAYHTRDYMTHWKTQTRSQISTRFYFKKTKIWQFFQKMFRWSEPTIVSRASSSLSGTRVSLQPIQ